MAGVSPSVIRIRSGSVALAAIQPAPITPRAPVAPDGSTPIQIAIENPMIARIESEKYVMSAIRP
ncbi:MAG TPA: hypothetical protein VF469_30245 [Kofleriaceae bacterium]